MPRKSATNFSHLVNNFSVLFIPFLYFFAIFNLLSMLIIKSSRKILIQGLVTKISNIDVMNSLTLRCKLHNKD